MCDRLRALRRRCEGKTELLRRIADEEAARAVADRSYRRRRRRPPTVPSLSVFDLTVAEEWLDAHRKLPVRERHKHPSVSDSVAAFWVEASSLSENRYWQRRRRLAVQLLATVAGCSERTVRTAVGKAEKRVARGEDPILVRSPDLEWWPERIPEWIVGRPPTDREEKETRRSRLDPGRRGL